MSCEGQSARDSPRIQHPIPGIRIFDDDIVRNTVVNESQQDERVSFDFSPIPLEDFDAKMKCLPNSPIPKNNINPESPCCDNAYSFGPPMTIYKKIAEEEISLLSSEDDLNGVSNNYHPQFMNPFSFGRKILHMIGFQDFSAPLNLCGPLSQRSDENVGRGTMVKSSSLQEKAWKSETFLDIQKRRVILTNEQLLPQGNQDNCQPRIIDN
jgi:hypothetical protein